MASVAESSLKMPNQRARFLGRTIPGAERLPRPENISFGDRAAAYRRHRIMTPLRRCAWRYFEDSPGGFINSDTPRHDYR